MEKVPKDVIEKITNELSPRDFINFCNSDTNKTFCERKDIWDRRLKKDFGFLLSRLQYTENTRNTYLSLFLKTSKATEKLIEAVKKYLKNYDYNTLYDLFFNLLIESLKQSIKMEIGNFDKSTIMQILRLYGIDDIRDKMTIDFTTHESVEEEIDHEIFFGMRDYLREILLNLPKVVEKKVKGKRAIKRKG